MQAYTAPDIDNLSLKIADQTYGSADSYKWVVWCS